MNLPDGKKPSATDHLANERTFLAWIRTGIAIMAFGFVVVKFALFVKQASLMLAAQHIAVTSDQQTSSAYVGIGLIALGTIVCLLAFFRYKNIEQQLMSNSFFPSLTLSVLLTISIMLIGVLLLFYLAANVTSTL